MERGGGMEKVDRMILAPVCSQDLCAGFLDVNTM